MIKRQRHKCEGGKNAEHSFSCIYGLLLNSADHSFGFCVNLKQEILKAFQLMG